MSDDEQEQRQYSRFRYATNAELCPTMTDDERTTLTVQYSDDMQAYILAVDELRNSHVIPLILEVDATAINWRAKIFNKAGVKRELSDTVKAMKLAYYCHTIRKTRELPGERNNARNNARCTQARKTTHGLDGQHQDVDRTPRGRVSQNDRG